jgi:acetyl-CoA carboxylase biotin carboxylase subunit
MFSKILVANRGEIALRIIRAAKELGIRTVAVYSESDRLSLHAMYADEKVCIGPSRAQDSYLNIPNILSAAEITKADAIHPGYGFLAENARFAEICESSGLTFIGPPASVIRLMGNKQRAREEMKKAGLPIIPGSDKVVEDIAEARKIAQKIGLPVILKAASGGGGKGMRIVRSISPSSKNNSPSLRTKLGLLLATPLFIWRNLSRRPGMWKFRWWLIKKVMSLPWERENVPSSANIKSSSRKRPLPLLMKRLRRKMLKAVREAAENIGYESLGTFEFLVDEKKKFYFMEANTRIQVEHPVTEMLYNIDLMKQQIRIAAGEKLSLPDELEPRGHSIECRINAEDPQTFTPSPGKIDFLVLPGGEGIRVDSAAYSGWVIPPDYDSLIAKVCALAPTRELALRKIRAALEMTTISGIKTNIPLHLRILANADFQSGNYDIQFLERLIQSETALE